MFQQIRSIGKEIRKAYVPIGILAFTDLHLLQVTGVPQGHLI